MLGPLIKAQAVAFLTKKLLESKLFNKAVESAHGSFSALQESAYDALLKATQEEERNSLGSSTSTPPPPPPPRSQGRLNRTSQNEASNLSQNEASNHTNSSGSIPPNVRAEEPISQQNDELYRLIQKMKDDLRKNGKL